MSTSVESPPTLTVADNVARITLNRPSRRNSLPSADIAAFISALDQIEADDSVHAVMIIGTGSVFSAGYDLDELTETLSGSSTSPESAFSSMVDRLENVAVPTLAAINGGVYGGATDLALACDIRLAVDTVKAAMPAARFGIHYYPSGLRRYVERLGLFAANRIFLTAETIGAEELLRLGYIQELVPADQFPRRVEDLARKMAALEPKAARSMKQSFREIAAGQFDFDRAEAAWRDSLRSNEVARRVSDGRKPK